MSIFGSSDRIFTTGMREDLIDLLKVFHDIPADNDCHHDEQVEDNN